MLDVEVVPILAQTPVAQAEEQVAPVGEAVEATGADTGARRGEGEHMPEGLTLTLPIT